MIARGTWRPLLWLDDSASASRFHQDVVKIAVGKVDLLPETGSSPSE